MDMYVANATTQAQDFYYQVPGSPRPYVQRITPGQQIKLAGVKTSEEAQAVIEHHKNYGMVRFDDVDTGRVRAPLLYSLDKPIGSNRIGYANERNINALETEADERLKMGAAAISGNLQQRATDISPKDSVGEVELSLVEQAEKSTDSIQTDKTVLVESARGGSSKSKRSRRG